MPRPTPSSYPKHQRWRFLQRFVEDRDLLQFAENIRTNDGAKIDDVLPMVFHRLGVNSNLKRYWLGLWVNYMHQMGLGYTWAGGKQLSQTSLCNFLCETKDIKSYYLYWGLKFQFPFSYPKHQHYIDNDVAIQPIVLILQYLCQIYSLTGSISASYLTKSEITKFLMREKDHTGILLNSKQIIANRQNGYDYSQEESATVGFNEAGDHFFSRGKLFIEKVEIVKFAGDRIRIENNTHLQKVKGYLGHATQPLRFTENSMDMRNRYITQSFNRLIPYPMFLSDANLDSPKAQSEFEQKVGAELVKAITNPTDLSGDFSKVLGKVRLFQGNLRKDLLVLYHHKCCMCDLDDDKFLRTAHIVGVEIDPSIAADRSNCMILCVLHDVAFENGLIAVSDDYKIKINSKNAAKLQHPLLKKELLDREGQLISLPDDLKPKIKYLRRHRRMHNFNS